jgi:hypothetical protein
VKAGLKEIVMRAQREGKVRVTDSAGRDVQLAKAGRPRVNPTNVLAGTVVSEFTLLVGLGLKSINEAGKSYKAYIRAKQDVKAAVTRAWEIHPQKPRVVTPYMHMTTFHCAGKADPSNLYIVWIKGALDALKNAGAVVEDSAPWDRGGSYGPVVLNANADAAELKVWAVGATF